MVDKAKLHQYSKFCLKIPGRIVSKYPDFEFRDNASKMFLISYNIIKFKCRLNPTRERFTLTSNMKPSNGL